MAGGRRVRDARCTAPGSTSRPSRLLPHVWLPPQAAQRAAGATAPFTRGDGCSRRRALLHACMRRRWGCGHGSAGLTAAAMCLMLCRGAGPRAGGPGVLRRGAAQRRAAGQRLRGAGATGRHRGARGWVGPRVGVWWGWGVGRRVEGVPAALHFGRFPELPIAHFGHAHMRAHRQHHRRLPGRL